MMYYLNGKYISDNECTISIYDRGFLLGDGIFTTMKSIHGRLLYLADHFMRLQDNAKKIYLKFAVTEEELVAIASKLIVANNLENKTALIRISITRESKRRGIMIDEMCTSNLLVTVTSYQQQDVVPLRLCTVRERRNEHSLLAKIKSNNYLEHIIASQDAKARGFDDALWQNTIGYITETPTANIFFVTTNNQLITPAISCGVLPGIMRKQIMGIASKAGLKIAEEILELSDLVKFSGAFISNCAINLAPVAQIDEHVFPVANILESRFLPENILTIGE